jgi:hypothetical protein
MKWTSVDVTFREVARVSMWTPKQESLGGKLIARERRGTAAERLKGFRFSFRFNHQRIQMANAEAKRTSGDRSRKLALHIFLDQLIKC